MDSVTEMIVGDVDIQVKCIANFSDWVNTKNGFIKGNFYKMVRRYITHSDIKMCTIIDDNGKDFSFHVDAGDPLANWFGHYFKNLEEIREEKINEILK